MRLLVCLVLVLILGPQGSIAHAHVGQNSVTTPPPGIEWLRLEPLEEGSEFAALLDAEARGLLDTQQLERLSVALRHYAAVQEVDRFPQQQADPDTREYNRQMGDNALRELLGGLQPSLHLDFAAESAPPDVHRPVPYHEVTQCLLLKVDVGGEGLSARSQILPMQQERYLAPYRIDVAANGTTWVLLRLRDAAISRSTTGLQFVKDGEQDAFQWHAITLEPKEPGHLRLDVVDESGHSSPAFVQIRHVDSGRLWPITDHHDFQPIVHDVTGPPEQMLWWLPIHGPQGSVKVTVPGIEPGYMWLVSSPVEVTLPEGRWEVTVLRGVEFLARRETVHVTGGEWKECTIEVPRWVNMAERGWFSGDDHVHGRLMNSSDARFLLTLARAMDVRVSNILEMGDAHRTYYTQRGFGEHFRVVEDGTWLIPGQEDPRSILGHNIGLNLVRLTRDERRYHDLEWMSQEVRAQGGLFGQTHVGQNACWADRGMALMMVHEAYDFASIMQGGLGTELYHDFLNLGFKLPASAGSDMPYAGVLGDVRVYAHIGSLESFTPDAWFHALAAGRTFTTNGPMIEFTVNESLPGSEILLLDDASVFVKARAWGPEHISGVMRLEIFSLGEIVGSRESMDGTQAVELEMTLNVGDGAWIAAVAHGANGSAAHTTPVYVRRPGKRHWNLERAEAIIDRQLAVLDDIEQVITGVEAMQEAGTLNRLDFENVLIARQKVEKRALLARSRAAYEALREEAIKQRNGREGS